MRLFGLNNKIPATAGFFSGKCKWLVAESMITALNKSLVNKNVLRFCHSGA